MKNEHESVTGSAENSVAFKKVMRGFDPAEVIAYIDEMSRTMQDASKNYEMRMAEMKQELTLISRERDNLAEKCRELENTGKKPEPQPVPEQTAEEEKKNEKKDDKKDDKKQAQLIKLQKQLEDERAAAASAEESLKKADSQIETLSLQLKNCLEQIESLEKDAQKNNEFSSQYEDALRQIENLRAEVSKEQEKNELLCAEMKSTEAHLKKTEEENSGLKTETGRLNVENSLLTEKNEQYKKELANLKAEAKEKAYYYAEKLTAGEDALGQERIKLNKKMQMQSYHIEQARAAVEELKNQLELIGTSLGE